MAGGASEGGGSACAVCRHQRRRCGPGCPMALYFPASSAQDFRDVHRLFGLNNITKVYSSLPPGDQRDTAMRTMIFEARLWRLDPVRGAYGLIRDLLEKIEATKAELDAVRAQLAFYETEASARVLSQLVPVVPQGPAPFAHPLYDVMVSPQMDIVPSTMEADTVQYRDAQPPASQVPAPQGTPPVAHPLSIMGSPLIDTVPLMVDADTVHLDDQLASPGSCSLVEYLDSKDQVANDFTDHFLLASSPLAGSEA